MSADMSVSDDDAITAVLEDWALATRTGAQDRVLKAFLSDALIYDVLAPMKYEGTEAYRASWGEWQPKTQGDGVFDLEDLAVTAGPAVAFATALIRCGGTMPDGRSFTDLVRATFCLRRVEDAWRITHTHISKPIGRESVA